MLNTDLNCDKCRVASELLRYFWTFKAKKMKMFVFPSEPIIKPVKTKQFTLTEQELPATVFDME